MRKTILIAVVAIMLFSSIGLLTGHSVNTTVQTPGGAGNAISAVAMTDDSNGNLFVLWSNGYVFEHPDNGASNYWIYLGNASAIYNYKTSQIKLGNPVGIRASLNWYNSKGVDTGLLMVLFSNGYVSTMEYGVYPHYWKINKITNSNNTTFVALAYDLDENFWGGYVGLNPTKVETFYAMESNGIIYAYSDANYKWTIIQSTPLPVNLTTFLVWPNNGPPYGVTTFVGLSRNGSVYFAAGSTNPLSPINWTYEGTIKATNPDFVSITQTPNYNSPYYYYAIMGTPNSYVYATATYNATASSWSPIAQTHTSFQQVAIQNKYYGVVLKADELILTTNGQIYSSTTEGATWSLQYNVPNNRIPQQAKVVMAWTCSFCTGVFNGMPRMNASILQIEQNRQDFTAISYEFYQLNSSGGVNPLSLGTLSYANSSNPYNITPILHKLNLQTYPMIISANLSNIEYFLSNSTKENDVINQMVTYALLYNYTGYNIDWEPTSANSSVGIEFANFLNEFAIQLNKYGRHLTVDIATWNPGFWNFSLIGSTNVTYVDVMDYSAIYSGPGSFMSDLSYAMQTIPNAKLQVALINTNVNTNSNLTPFQMSQRFAALEYYNITSLSMWVLPVNSSILSMMQQFLEMRSYGHYYIGGVPGSSGFIFSTNQSGIGFVKISEVNGSYVNGSAFFRTNFILPTNLTGIAIGSMGNISVEVMAENSSGWYYVATVNGTQNISVNLKSGTYNIGFLVNSTAGFIMTNYSESITYTLTGTIFYPGWLLIHMPVGYYAAINGSLLNYTVFNYTTYNYGIYEVVNITLPSGTYNVLEQSTSGQINMQTIEIESEHVTSIYTQTAPIPEGTIKGFVYPSSATVTINGVPVSVYSNGFFSENITQGSYWVNASDNFYKPFSTKVTVVSGEVTWINITLSPAPPSAVQLYVPTMVNNTTFKIAWSQFIGIGFINYTIYISTSTGALGSPIASITNVSETTYVLTNLSYNTTYYVAVKVFSQGGSALSNFQSFKTPAKVTTTTVIRPTKSSSPEIYTMISVVAVIIIVAIVIIALMAIRSRNKLRK